MKKLLFATGLLLLIFAPSQQFIYAEDPTGTCSCIYLSQKSNDKPACETEGCKWNVACQCAETYSKTTAASCTSLETALGGACTFNADAVPPTDPGTIPPTDPGTTPPTEPPTDPGTSPKSTTSESTYELPNFLGITDPNILINRIIRAILGVTGSAALIIFIYGGFLWLTSAGSDSKVQKGTNAMKWAAIGLVVIFSAYVLVSFILTSLATVAK